jgi:RNA polymerase sigma-70 factor (ECF subfamily)
MQEAGVMEGHRQPEDGIQGDLIARLRQRDPVAFEEFVSLVGPRLLNFGRRMCGDREDAREVFQDTLLKTFEAIDDLKNPGAFKTWLYRIAANACRMRRRKSQFLKEEISLEDALPNRPPGEAAPMPWEELPDRVLLNDELREHLQGAILELPEDSRAVLVLRDVEGLTTEEVAEALSLSKDVVKMRLHRARAKVRNHLAEYLEQSSN